MAKRKREQTKKAKVSTSNEPTEEILPPVRTSDEVPAKKLKWINKQRVLVFSSRGVSHRERHLMVNLKAMMPHSKSEPKINSKDSKLLINEVCEVRNCNKILYFENKKKKDLYLWACSTSGPSAKFLVENIHTTQELKMSGNSLKYSRPVLSFDSSFDELPHFALLKELFVQIFGTPNYHPKSQPFVDHVITFSLMDDKIWFRNYQIVDENGAMAEIGPRFVLHLIKIFEGSFGGPVLYTNANYLPPNKHRQMVRKAALSKYNDRVLSKKGREDRDRRDDAYKELDKYNEVFEPIAKKMKNTKRKKVKKPKASAKQTSE